MDGRRVGGLWQRLLPGIGCVIVWLALCLLGIWVGLRLGTNVLDFLYLARVSQWTIGAATRFGIIILGIVWLAGAIFLFEHLREGIAKNSFARRVVRVFLIEAALLAVSYGLQWMLLLF